MSHLVVRTDTFFVTRLQINSIGEMSSADKLDLSVFLMNYTQIDVSFNSKAESLTASEVLDEVHRHLCDEGLGDGHQMFFDSEYKRLFAIWVTSPSLELQLQPKHKPFCVLAKWDHLLEKHGPTQLLTDPTLLEKDTPTLSFQRNVFCDKSMESLIPEGDIGALYLLYIEAKLNVLQGRYPTDNFELLAAYQAAIESPSGGVEESKMSVDYFRTHLKEYIPRNQIKTDGNRMTGLIRTLSRGSPSMVCAQNITKKYREIPNDNNRFSAYKLLKGYLQLCWQIPCYGSAFFSAQIERPVKSKLDSLKSHYDLEVWVAINQIGLHVISKEKPEILLSIDINDLCWAVGCPTNSDPDCIPCIFIQMPDKKSETPEILQIFSRQYKLIESLLSSFIKDKRSSLRVSRSLDLNGSNDVPDGLIRAQRDVPLNCEPSTKVTRVNKPGKLCLAKFDEAGNYKNKTGSWLRVQNQRNRD